MHPDKNQIARKDQPAPLPAGRSWRLVRDVAGVLAALALYSWMALSAADRQSPVFDESPHLSSGAAVWLMGDYRLNPESGVLVERWLALPDLVWRPDLSALSGRDWLRSDVWKVGDSFLYASGNDADTLARRARIMATLVAATLGAVIFLWSRRINGVRGGWISLALFVFCPTMLAHGPLATADVMTALFFALGTWAISRLIARVSGVAILGAASAIGALCLSKFSWPIIVFVAAGMVVVRVVRHPSLTLAFRSRAWTIDGRGRVLGTYAVTAGLISVLVFAMIWGAYGFRYVAFSPRADDGDSAFQIPWSGVTDASTTVGQTLLWTRDHQLLPEAFVYGLAHTLKFSEKRPAFLNGQFETTGTVEFFPYAFLVKTPLPLLLLALGGILAALGVGPAFLRRQTARGEDADSSNLWPLAILVGVYSLFTLSSHLNIGHRYLLPLYPPLFIFAGGLGRWLVPRADAQTASSMPATKGRSRSRRGKAQDVPDPRRWRAVGAAAIAVCLAWHIGESVYARPDYLAYMNEIAGGPAHGYQHLVDSSIDWGQDLPELKQWLDAQSQSAGTPVYLSYFGSARPSYYGISAVMLPALLDRRTPGLPVPLGGGIYCVSATMLEAVYLAAPGPWTETYETQYQQMLHNVQAFEATAPNSKERADAENALGPARWNQIFQLFEQYRAARLFAYLRRREPDANVGHSILIFRLTDDEAGQAQLGPAPM